MIESSFVIEINSVGNIQFKMSCKQKLNIVPLISVDNHCLREVLLLESRKYRNHYCSVPELVIVHIDQIIDNFSFCSVISPGATNYSCKRKNLNFYL